MNTDIRIDIKLPRHWKYRKLKRLLGCAPMEYLVFFWTAVAEQMPSGQLIGWSKEDIEEAAEWGGDSGVFFDAMIECRLLDVTENGFCPHDWDEHQPWATGARERSDAAKKAAKARWGKTGAQEPQCGTDAGRMRGAQEPQCGTDAQNAPSPSPSPSPLPTSKPLTTEEERARSFPRMPITEIQKLYVEYLGKIPQSQPVVSVLQDICREYPPENIKEAFQSVASADKPNLNWIKTYLNNPKNWGAANGSRSSSRTAQVGRKTGLIEANGAGTDFLS